MRPVLPDLGRPPCSAEDWLDALIQINGASLSGPSTPCAVPSPPGRLGLGEQGLERCPPLSEDGRGGSASGAFGLATMPLDKALDGLVAEPALGIHA
jgi:hypothetical protein